MHSGMKGGMIIGNTIMKTAISIREPLLREADMAARTMGVSRSQLFAVAVSDFLRRRRQEDMLNRLNEVYANGMEADEKAVLRGMKAKARPKERW